VRLPQTKSRSVKFNIQKSTSQRMVHCHGHSQHWDGSVAEGSLVRLPLQGMHAALLLPAAGEFDHVPGLQDKVTQG
jgi:hypothetical protein